MTRIIYGTRSIPVNKKDKSLRLSYSPTIEVLLKTVMEDGVVEIWQEEKVAYVLDTKHMHAVVELIRANRYLNTYAELSKLPK